MDVDALETTYYEMRQQLAEQGAEIERVDRKATALLTPIGLLIGLALNSKLTTHPISGVDYLLYAGLAVLAGGLLAGVGTLWPRSFRRPTPGEYEQVRGRFGFDEARFNWWRRLTIRAGRQLVAIGAESPADRRSREGVHAYPPMWSEPTREQTLESLNSQLAAAWRVNRSLLPGKLRWLQGEFVCMMVGSTALVLWYSVRTLPF